ncbi:methenyltetrahydromethanopterin cyclohydrolase [Methanonatronarchaeum sp. AMET6-2]|uniref:methenyltetrahydromethanopterin cyclohydrolase n=1 Tax=Methanonatronarchaeum sp. AMET6-2 TaxID=2933293 RepID=UPI001FF29A28|nr:methenyltetrahydromethanopterin cyclohydrolase [Methanonatronarchaeum sp. AMET6-2]UOY09876.1 methenyltetrahydromethanopterin cyclohydrolase [Methanonatronarchaeum sp. AMET6-2]
MNVNETTISIIEEMIAWSEETNIKVKEIGDAVLLDCSEGGYDAGALYSMACQGGLATTGFTETEVGDYTLPATQNYTDNPLTACIDCQKASVNLGGAIASGPAKLLLGECNTHRTENSDYAVIALETNQTPTKEEINEFASRCGVQNKCLYIITAPTNSQVGAIQISARAIETALFKLDRLDYDLSKIKNAFSVTPIPPTAETQEEAMGRTNDAIIYGGKVHLTTEEYDPIFEKIPSNQSKNYGKSMIEAYMDADREFHKIDQDFFAPAEITVNSLDDGKLRKHGEINTNKMIDSFGMEE